MGGSLCSPDEVWAGIPESFALSGQASRLSHVSWNASGLTWNQLLFTTADKQCKWAHLAPVELRRLQAWNALHHHQWQCKTCAPR